jgi:hypothetical protein
MFVFGTRVAGPRPVQPFVRIVVKFELTAADAPNNTPAVVARELTQVGVAHGMEKFQLDRVRDKVLRPAYQGLRDNASHQFELGEAFFLHRMVNRL